MNVFEMIDAQLAKVPKGDVAWCVGQTLKRICQDPDCAAIVAEDLQNKSMSITECAKKNKENADRIHKETKGRCVYVSEEEEERIIREFYGLPAAAPQLTVIRPEEPAPVAEVPDLFGMDEPFPDLFSL